MTIHVGSAPDSWGVWFPSDPKQTPWHRCLDEIAAAGYEWTELGPYGYMPTDLATLQSELARRNLKVTGAVGMTHLEDPTAWPELERQVTGAGELLAALGARYLVLIDDVFTDLWTGKLIRPDHLDDDGWKHLADTTHRAADLAKSRFGLDTVFHPHADTHIASEEEIDRLLEITDPARVGLCLDTGHHAYCGGEPVSFFRKHHQRIPYLHLKSVDVEKHARVLREKIPFALAVADDVFCEPSLGAVDFIAFRDALREVNYDGWAIVEQDMYPAPFDKPFPIAQRSRAYLREIGIG